MKLIPQLSVDLIEQLDKDEGQLRVKHDTPHTEILWKAARRELINELKTRLEWSNKQHNKKEVTI
jgi:hypothetical protein